MWRQGPEWWVLCRHNFGFTDGASSYKESSNTLATQVVDMQLDVVPGGLRAVFTDLYAYRHDLSWAV